MRLDNWLARSAAATPDRVALAAGGERLTYGELERAATERAHRLAGLGARRGTRVALALAMSREYVVLIHALMKLGAVAVPLASDLPEPELERRLGEARVGVVVRDADEVAAAPAGPADLEPELDLASTHCVIFTSGTGGSAKPVELTYGNHLWSAAGSGFRIGVDPDDRWLCSLGLHHIGGLAIVLRSALYGTGVVLERFDPASIARAVVEERVTLASVVATMLSRLLDAGAELERLRCVLLGGGPAPGALIETALERGVPLAPTYGLTEAASQVTTLPPGELVRKPGSAGTAILRCEVRVEGGVIHVRGANVSAREAGADGWLRTGDRGRLDADGHLYVEGRADDLILSGGEKVDPEEVERALLAHPEVAEAAAGGREDEQWQQAVVAVVVLRDGGTVGEEGLREFCRHRLAPFQVPKRITFVARLPRDEHGKLRRREL
jgi:O-succinylbenzoic acid--CoA ligase